MAAMTSCLPNVAKMEFSEMIRALIGVYFCGASVELASLPVQESTNDEQRPRKLTEEARKHTDRALYLMLSKEEFSVTIRPFISGCFRVLSVELASACHQIEHCRGIPRRAKKLGWNVDIC
jgi:hypothetical protein